MKSPEGISSIGGSAMTRSNNWLRKINQEDQTVEAKEMIISSGKKCTVSGEWAVYHSISTTMCLSKGDVMPEYCGKTVKWILIIAG